MARWINYTAAGAILLILTTIHQAQGYRADPKSVARLKREADATNPIEIQTPEEVKPSISPNSNNDTSNDSKITKPATRNRGKIKYHNTQQSPKLSEKPTSVKRTVESEKQLVARTLVRSRQARNVSETTAVIPETTTEVNISSETSTTVTLPNSTANTTDEIPIFDISKYVSADFHNNPYEQSNSEESTVMTLQVHDPVEAVKGIRAVDGVFRFDDELTTPKTPLFDGHHSEVREEIDAHISEGNGRKIEDEPNIDLVHLAEKAKTDNNTSIDVVSVKELYHSDSIVDGHIKKEFLSSNGTNIVYQTSELKNNTDVSTEDTMTAPSITTITSVTDQTKTNKNEVVTSEPSIVVTTKTLHDNATAFVNNLDVKVREVFPDLSTPTTKIDAHTPAAMMTIPVVDTTSNSSHPRLRISVKTNKVDYGNDSDTTEKVAERASSTREQKSYFASTPDTNVDGKASNEIQQAQESRGTTKIYRQAVFDPSTVNANTETTGQRFNMNLPDNADVWSLVGLKHVPPQKRNNTFTTDLPSNIKQLADWSEIMKNEANSSEVSFNPVVTSVKTTTNSHHTESQGEENKLIPVQVPAPTKQSNLVVDSNVPSNDITTIKPEDIVHKDIAHTTPIRTTNDYRDTLQFNRVDVFEISSSTESSTTISANRTERIPVILRAPTTTSTTVPTITINSATESILITKHETKNHSMPHTTSNILEILGPSQINSTMDVVPVTSEYTTEDNNDTSSTIMEEETEATTSVSESSGTTQITEITENSSGSTNSGESGSTEIIYSEASTEIMYNDSPSYSTTVSQEGTTSFIEEPTTEYSTEGVVPTTFINTLVESTTEDSTTLNEPIVVTSTEAMYDLLHTTDSSTYNKSSLPVIVSIATTSSKPEMIETTISNTILKSLNTTPETNEVTNASSSLFVTTIVTPRSNSSPTPESHDFEDDIDDYSDNSDANELNLNNNVNNVSSADEGTTKTVVTTKSTEHVAVVPTVHKGDENRERPDVATERTETTSRQSTIDESVTIPYMPIARDRNGRPVNAGPNHMTEPTTGDPNDLGSREPPEDSGAIAAVTISAVGVIALIALVALLYVMRKRQHKRTYGQRCTPVSLDAYSVDSVSVYSSVRGKNRARASKRSYGNPAYNDSGMTSHSMSFPALSNFASDEAAVFAEFTEIPTVTVRADEVPPGCEVKNRYANVMPLPETRVPLQAKPGDDLGGYINANYVRGHRGIRNYYIACQAPMQSTVNDFWRMIWEQQSKVILMITDLYENGVEKCADYLPPSEVLDCHRLFGDYKVTLKKREVKDKYVISNVQLCNMESGTWREITHLWYLWPEKGVPREYHSMIAFLIEARSFMKSPHDKIDNNNTPKTAATTTTPPNKTSASSTKENNEVNVYSPQQAQKAYRKTHRAPSEPIDNNISSETSSNQQANGSRAVAGSAPVTTKLTTINEKQNGGSSGPSLAPVVVHCSPGTGRTGAVIACDLAIREFEFNRTVDLPKTVYRIRRDRANAVQTKEQYMFVYQVINLYATKLTGGVLDSI